MNFRQTPTFLTLLTAGMLALTGCGGSSNSSSEQSTTGPLSIGLTDGPIDDAISVWIQFTGLELKPAGDGPAESYAFDPDSCDVYDDVAETCTIDMLALQGTQQRTIFADNLELGEYEWIRLLVNADRNVIDSYVEFEGPAWCPLWIPSGAQRGLQINGPLQVTTNGSRYILDVDLYKSIIQPPGLAGTPNPDMCVDNYLMKPVIRIVDDGDAGSIAGVVDRSLLFDDIGEASVFAGCELNEENYFDDLKVYVFEDFADQPTPAALDDYDEEGDAPDPVASAFVEYDMETEEYSYEVGYLLTGDYHLGLACNAGLDVAEEEDFVSGVDVIGTCEDAESDPAFCFVAERSVNVMEEMINNGDFPEASP